MNDYLNRFIKKLPKKNFIIRYIKTKIEERTRQKHYTLIGELTVKFSNLEQTIKFLGRDFQPSNILTKKQETYDRLSGKSLAEATKEYIKQATLPGDIKEEIFSFLDNYKTIAKDRNKLLKSQYSYQENSKNMSQVDMSLFQKIQKNPREYNDFIQKWIVPFDPKEAERCIKNTQNLSNQINAILGKIIKLRVRSYFDKKS